MEDPKDPKHPELTREPDGRFAQGNAGGRMGGRRKLPVEVLEYYEDAYRIKGAKRLVEALDAMKIQGKYTEAPDHDVRLKAFELMHTILYGKPVQPIASEEGPLLQISSSEAVLQALQHLAPKEGPK